MCRMSVDGSVLSQELHTMTGVEEGATLGVAETGADLKRGRSEVGGVSNYYGAQSQDVGSIQISGGGERYWLWGG